MVKTLTPPERSALHTRNVLTFILTFTAGATDAIGFLALGEAFTSVMTGNIVLLGISISNNDGDLARHITTAIACYLVGCVLGARIAGSPRQRQPQWPPQVTRALAVEFAIFTVGSILWWASGSSPRDTTQLLVLSMYALALGVQGSAVLRFGDSGLSTTYMTGKLTKIIASLVAGASIRDVARNITLLGSLLIGAIAAALLVRHSPHFVPLLQLIPLIGVLVGSTLMKDPPPDGHDS